MCHWPNDSQTTISSLLLGWKCLYELFLFFLSFIYSYNFRGEKMLTVCLSWHLAVVATEINADWLISLLMLNINYYDFFSFFLVCAKNQELIYHFVACILILIASIVFLVYLYDKQRFGTAFNNYEEQRKALIGAGVSKQFLLTSFKSTERQWFFWRQIVNQLVFAMKFIVQGSGAIMSTIQSDFWAQFEPK